MQYLTQQFVGENVTKSWKQAAVAWLTFPLCASPSISALWPLLTPLLHPSCPPLGARGQWGRWLSVKDHLIVCREESARLYDCCSFYCVYPETTDEHFAVICSDPGDLLPSEGLTAGLRSVSAVISWVHEGGCVHPEQGAVEQGGGGAWGGLCGHHVDLVDHSRTSLHTHTQRPNQYGTKEGGRTCQEEDGGG